MQTFSLCTIGCRLNQYETEAAGAKLQALGFQEVAFGEPAELCIINTCSVTARADADARKALRRARRSAPQGRIVLTGCYASAFRAELEASGDADLLVDNRDKEQLVARLVEAFGCTLPPAAARNGTPRQRLVRHHTRAMVKIQDGCQEACSYCIIPRARGRERSRPLQEVVAEVRTLEAAGYKEVVLTGVHAGKYRHEGHRLSDLLAALLRDTRVAQIRLSSLEPRELRPALVDLITHEPRVCPHLHIPLQSGHDGVLRRMRRSYDSAWVEGLFARLQAARADLALGTDVMAGFPGETEAQFQTTVAFLQNLPLAYLHVFSYSDRPGTEAERLGHKVPEDAVRARGRELRELGAQLRKRYYSKFVGRTLPVLVEQRRQAATGRLLGLTGNYLRVLTDGPDHWMNQIVHLKIERLEGDFALATAA